MKNRFFIGIALVIGGCSSVSTYPPLDVTQKTVSLVRYMGLWFEIAKGVGSDEECTNTTTYYTLKKDGDIRALKKCVVSSDHSVNLEDSQLFVEDKVTNTKMKFQIWGPFYEDYWILYLDQDYQYALIGSPSRKYLSILSRSSTLEDTIYQQLLNIAKNKGFDISKIEKTKHHKPFTEE